MARNPKPVRRLYKTIQAGVRNRSGRPLRNLTYDHIRDAMRPVTTWEWRGPCDHPNKGVTYRDAVVTAWACPDCETEWDEHWSGFQPARPMRAVNRPEEVK